MYVFLKKTEMLFGTTLLLLSGSIFPSSIAIKYLGLRYKTIGFVF